MLAGSNLLLNPFSKKRRQVRNVSQCTRYLTDRIELSVSRELWKADSRGVMRKLPNSTISFRLSVLSQEVDVGQLRAAQAISQAEGSLGQMGDAPPAVSRTAKATEGMAGIVDQAADGVQSLSDTWDSLLSKIEIFVKLTDTVSEV